MSDFRIMVTTVPCSDMAVPDVKIIVFDNKMTAQRVAKDINDRGLDYNGVFIQRSILLFDI